MPSSTLIQPIDQGRKNPSESEMVPHQIVLDVLGVLAALAALWWCDGGDGVVILSTMSTISTMSTTQSDKYLFPIPFAIVTSDQLVLWGPSHSSALPHEGSLA